MAYSLSRSEMETHVRRDDEEQVAHIWTSSPMTIRKLDKLVAELPDVYKCVKRDGGCAKYETSMKRIKFSKPQIMTEARLEASRKAVVLAQEARKARAQPATEGGDS